LGALALVTSGLVLRPALASNQQADGDRAASQASGGLDKETVLVASTEAAPAAAPRVPSAKVTPPPSSSSGFRWTGFYVGGSIGYASGNAKTSVNPLPSAAQFVNLAPTTLPSNPSGMVGGGHAGYNLQGGEDNHYLIGGEFDFSYFGLDTTQVVHPIIQNNGTPFPGASPGNNITAHQDRSWFATLRPRAGVILVPRLLIYGTAGLAFGHVKASASTDFRPAGTELYPAAADQTKRGWAAGAGAEIAFGRRWTARGEYLHYDLGKLSLTANPSVPFPPPPFPQFQIAYQWQTTANIGRFGVNFKF